MAGGESVSFDQDRSMVPSMCVFDAVLMRPFSAIMSDRKQEEKRKKNRTIKSHGHMEARQVPGKQHGKHLIRLEETGNCPRARISETDATRIQHVLRLQTSHLDPAT